MFHFHLCVECVRLHIQHIRAGQVERREKKLKKTIQEEEKKSESHDSAVKCKPVTHEFGHEKSVCS